MWGEHLRHRDNNTDAPLNVNIKVPYYTHFPGLYFSLQTQKHLAWSVVTKLGGSNALCDIREGL